MGVRVHRRRQQGTRAQVHDARRRVALAQRRRGAHGEDAPVLDDDGAIGERRGDDGEDLAGAVKCECRHDKLLAPTPNPSPQRERGVQNSAGKASGVLHSPIPPLPPKRGRG